MSRALKPSSNFAMAPEYSLGGWDNFPLQKLWQKRLKILIYPQGVGFLTFFATIPTGGKLSHAPSAVSARGRRQMVEISLAVTL